MAPDAHLALAAVVTEHQWERTENRVAIARQKRNAGRRKVVDPIPPDLVPVAFRLGHLDAKCTSAKAGTVVATEIPFTSAESGMPCSTCAMPHLTFAPRVDPVVDPNRPPSALTISTWTALAVHVFKLRHPGEPDTTTMRRVVAARAALEEGGRWTHTELLAAIDRGERTLERISDNAS